MLVVVFVDLVVVDLVVVDLVVVVVVGEIVVENVTAVVLVVVNSLCYSSSFSFSSRSFYPFSRQQGGYDDDGDVLCFVS